MQTPLTKAERETILLTSEADDTWNICTYNIAMINMLVKKSREIPQSVKIIDLDDEIHFGEFEVAKSMLSVRVKTPKTAEQIERARANMMKMLEEKKNAEK